MRKPRVLRKLLGIGLALGGAIILIEVIPLWILYGILGALFLFFILMLFRRI